MLRKCAVKMCYSISLRIQSECGKIQTRKTYVSGHFLHSAIVSVCAKFQKNKMCAEKWFSSFMWWNYRCNKSLSNTRKTKLFQQKVPQQISMFFSPFFITITLLIAVSIYCQLIKYRAKQKHYLLSYHHITNNKLKEVFY